MRLDKDPNCSVGYRIGEEIYYYVSSSYYLIVAQSLYMWRHGYTGARCKET